MDAWQIDALDQIELDAKNQGRSIEQATKIQFIRQIGGSGFARIFRLDTNVGTFVVKVPLPAQQDIYESDDIYDLENALDSENGLESVDQLMSVQPLVAEAHGLGALAKQPFVRVPRVIAAPDDSPREDRHIDDAPIHSSEPNFPLPPNPNCDAEKTANPSQLLITEFIESSSSKGFQAKSEEAFGRNLAKMHLALPNDRFGLERNNFLGATLQPNDWHDDWITFWLTQRLESQFRLAQQNGYYQDELKSLCESLLGKLPEILASPVKAKPCLIHGDLWNGNFWIDDQGKPVIIDPAVYYAPAEVEFGMTSLFGGLSQRFMDAYQEISPLSGDFQRRIAVYRFYHLINHLNLFGEGYFIQSVHCLHEILHPDN